MIVFEAHISDSSIERIVSSLEHGLERCNHALKGMTGIVDFFESEHELEMFRTSILENKPILNEDGRAEYGDFQTNLALAQSVCQLLKNSNIQPKTLIEPTCGKGNFVIAALAAFQSIEEIIAVEIYKPYVWQTKFSILDYFLNPADSSSADKNKPSIRVHHCNVFDFKFEKINCNQELLVIGNPPWVTNSMLAVLGSDNLPLKSNFKNHTGLDAITGKGNFDICEYISLMLIKAFHQLSGNLALLVKNSVIKNILQEQKRNQFFISNIQKHIIDAQKEFNAATNAALLWCQFGNKSDVYCEELDFYTRQKIKEFGWVGNKFVANLNSYHRYAAFDGTCPFEWRQGVKHDCSKVMELERENGHYVNGKGERIELEPDLMYGLLKSSDLKANPINSARKNTIITQKKPGQETQYIREYFPKTWKYLIGNQSDFDNRKSIIYQGKPLFSIFGIGDYSFAPYKVAISGLYKTSVFSLVLPQNDKPLMLDDTCYFIGFQSLADAIITTFLLNLPSVQGFLNSIIFWDSKRVVTKELLCRIDLKKVIRTVGFESIVSNENGITYQDWERYNQQFEVAEQLALF